MRGSVHSSEGAKLAECANRFETLHGWPLLLGNTTSCESKTLARCPFESLGSEKDMVAAAWFAEDIQQFRFCSCPVGSIITPLVMVSLSFLILLVYFCFRILFRCGGLRCISGHESTACAGPFMATSKSPSRCTSLGPHGKKMTFLLTWVVPCFFHIHTHKFHLFPSKSLFGPIKSMVAGFTYSMVAAVEWDININQYHHGSGPQAKNLSWKVMVAETRGEIKCGTRIAAGQVELWFFLLFFPKKWDAPKIWFAPKKFSFESSLSSTKKWCWKGQVDSLMALNHVIEKKTVRWVSRVWSPYLFR